MMDIQLIVDEELEPGTMGIMSVPPLEIFMLWSLTGSDDGAFARAMIDNNRVAVLHNVGPAPSATE